MKEYEIVAKFCNACSGSSRPQTFFEEATLESTDDFVRMKHRRDFAKPGEPQIFSFCGREPPQE